MTFFTASKKTKSWNFFLSQEHFKVASGGPEIASELVWDIFEFFDLFFQGESNNYEEEIIIISGRNKEEIILIFGLSRVWTGVRVTRQVRWDSTLKD